MSRTDVQPAPAAPHSGLPPEPDRAPAPRRARGSHAPRRVLFPGGIRLYHFIVIPAVGMGLVIALFRGLDQVVLPGLGPLNTDLYQVGRAMVMSLIMASLIAWIAFRHRREYEAKIQSRNVVLETTRDFLSRIIDASGEAIVTLDPEWRVTSWNHAAETIFGWRADEMLGRSVRDVFPSPEDMERARQAAEERLQAGETIRDLEARRVAKDGSLIVVQITRAPIFDGTGAYLGSTGVVRDVTALKEMEERLREKERLAAIGELSARVAHEVRNPLAGIRGACEILSEGHPEGDPLQEIAEEVLRQVDRLNNTVEDLLLFARPKPARTIRADIHEVLNLALRNLGEDSQARGVTVDRQYDPNLPLLEIDPDQMEQVLLNVLVNGAQAMDFRGRLTVSTRTLDGEAVITVRDTGPGVPEELSGRIFEPFFTTRTKGTGLGLAIVRNIVQGHGGSIRAASAPAGGAEFTITLPVPKPDGAS